MIQMKIVKNMISIAFLALFFTACSKGEDPIVEPEPEEEGFLAGTNWVPARVKKINDYAYLDEKFQVVYIVNLPCPDVGNSSSEGHRPLGFNFDSSMPIYGDNHNAGGLSAYTFETSSTWHFYVDNIYNSSFNTNATTADGQAGRGKVTVAKTLFDELDQVPSTADFTKNVNHLGLSEPNDSWGFYVFANHELRPYKDRSMLFLLQDGRYVKVQIVNLYKDNPAEAPNWREPTTKTLAPYLNFKYYVQKEVGNTTIKTR